MVGVAGEDDPFDVRMRLNLALSGEHDYEAGDIQVADPTLAGVFNMGGSAVANYVSILERAR